MKTSLIVAMSLNGVIGLDGVLPWKLSDDLKHFKKVTLGKPVIMGRKTFESIGKPLPKRMNIILSRTPGYTWIDPSGKCSVWVCDSLQEAIGLAKRNSTEEVIVIGGHSLFREAISFVDRMYVTHVEAVVEGDTFMPPIDWSKWTSVGRFSFRVKAGPKNDHPFMTETYERTS